MATDAEGVHLLIFILDIRQLNLTVNRLLVHVLDLLASHLINWFENPLVVQVERLHLDFAHDLWIFWKYFLVQFLFGKGETFYILVVGHVNKLRLALVYNVVITDVVRLALIILSAYLRDQSLAYLILLIGKSIRDQTECNSDVAFDDEIHFWHVLFLVVDDLIIIIGREVARHETESHVIEEATLLG